MKTVLPLQRSGAGMQLLSWLFLILAFVQLGQAQVAVSWTVNGSQWADFGPNPFSPTAVGANIIAGGLTRASGLTTSGSGAFNAWGANGWVGGSDASSQVALNKYVYFTIEAAPGYNLSLSNIDAYNIRHSGTGPTTGQWQYQVGAASAFVNLTAPLNWGSNTQAAGNNMPAISLSGVAALQNVPAGTRITFRVPNWGATGTTGTWYFNLQPLVFRGVATPAGPSCTAPNLSTSQINITCTNPTGSATAIPSGGQSPYSFLWSTGQSTATITGLAAATYTVTVTTADQCSATTSVTITSSGTPVVPVVSDDTTICRGRSATLVASGGTSYLWAPGGQTTSQITVSPAITTTYSVTVTNASSCSAVRSMTVTVNDPPTVSIEGDTQICYGEETTLTASGGTSYLWGPPGNQTTPDIQVAPETSTNYTLTVTDQNGCTAASSVFVTVLELPDPSIEGDLSICPGEETTLTASGGTSYVWSPGGEDAASIDVSPEATTTYTVTVTNENSCSATASVEVEVFEEVNADITGNTAVCAGLSTTLTATGGTSFLWSPGEETTASITVTPTDNTTYTVTVNNENGCSATASVEVEVNELPEANIEGDIEICQGETTVLTASGGSEYLWSPGAETSADISVTPIGNTTYAVIVSDANSCSASTSVTVIVHDLPAPEIVGNLAICTGSSTILTVTDGVSFLWAPGGQTTASITVSPTVTTNYIVTVTSGQGCTAIASAEVEVNALPNVSISGDTDICSGSVTELTASGGSSYLWAPGGQTTAAISVVPLSTTTYTVTVTNEESCSATASATVNVTQLPAPVVTASGPLSFCYGEGSVTLTTPLIPGYTYQWTVGGHDIPGATGLSYVAAESGVFRVRVNNNGCIAVSDPITVTGAAAPMAVILGNLEINICAGDIHTFQAVEGTGYTYQWYRDEEEIPGATGSSYTTSEAGHYYVEVSNGLCNRGSGTHILSVRAVPSVELFPDSVKICEGQPAVLFGTAKNADHLQWMRNGEKVEGANQLQLTTLLAGDYQLLASTNYACNAASDILVVSIIALEVPEIQASAPVICAGKPVVLTIKSSPGYTYQWYKNDNWIPGAIGTSLKTDQAGSYSVELRNAEGCIGRSELIELESLPFPEVTLKADTLLTGCKTRLITLKATANAGGGIQWFYQGEPVQSPINNTLAYAPKGTYMVVYDNGCGADSAWITVQEERGPSIQIVSKSKPVFCEGDSILLEAFPTGGSNFQWYHDFQLIAGANGPTLVVQEEGFYWLTADLNECPVRSGVFKAFVNPAPVVEITAEGSTEIPKGGSVALSAPADLSLHYQWWLDGNPIPGANSHNWLATEAGEYVLQAIRNGCTAYSNTIVVTESDTKPALGTRSNDQAAAFELLAFPIPAGNTLTLRSNLSGLHQLQISGMDGRLYISRDLQMEQKGDLNLDLTGLPTGMYILRCQYGKQLQHQLLPVQK